MLTSLNVDHGFDDFIVGKIIPLNGGGKIKSAARKKKQADAKLVEANDVQKAIDKLGLEEDEKELTRLREIVNNISITDKEKVVERFTALAAIDDLSEIIEKKKKKKEKLQKKYDKLKEQYDEDTSYSSTNPDPDKEYVTIKQNTKLKIGLPTLMVPTPEGENDTSLCTNPEWIESSRDVTYDDKGFSSVTIPMPDVILSSKIEGKKRITLKSKDTCVVTQEFITAKINLNSSKTDSADSAEEILSQLRRQIDDDVQKIKKKKMTFYVEVNGMVQCKCIGGKLDKWAYYIPEESIEDAEEDLEEEYDEEEYEEDYDLEDEDSEAVLQQYLNSRERGDISGADKYYN